MPLERATLLVLAPGAGPATPRPDARAAARRRAQPGAGGARDRRLARRRGSVRRRRRLAADRRPDRGRATALWASHLLALQAALPALRGRPPDRSSARCEPARTPRSSTRSVVPPRPPTRRCATSCSRRFAGRREVRSRPSSRELLLAHGHDRVDFTIVATGPNAASPHHEPTERVDRTRRRRRAGLRRRSRRVLQRHDPDAGRSGSPPELLVEVHAVVLEAQAAACAACAPGSRSARSIAPRDRVIEAAGYGERFFHRTGTASGSRCTSRRTPRTRTRPCSSRA